jgi:hypothetical protein
MAVGTLMFRKEIRGASENFKILSRVRVPWQLIMGSLIWSLGLLDVSITIILNYNSSYTFCVLSYFTSELCLQLIRFWTPGFNSSLTSVLRLTSVFFFSHCDWRSVSKSWCRAPTGAHDQIFIAVWQLRSCSLWGVLSDERAGLSFVHAAGPCQRSLSRGPRPLGVATIFYCLRFETSLFVASYDSQGRGRGIQHRLHTG